VGAGTYGNIAIIATERTGEPVSQSLAHWQVNARRLELDRMTQPQIGELIVAALGPASPSPTLIEDLERATAGNVYFVLEILRSLAARGLIERKRTRVLLPDSLARVELPASLAQAIERRLDSLSPSALALARVAAVVGRAMNLEFCRALFDATDDEFFDAVDELRREELIQWENRCFSISHPRLREVLYQGLGAHERKELHRRVANEILSHSQQDSGDRSAELGQHFAEAGDEARALAYLVRAGDARYRGFAYFDAREAYQRAFQLLHCAPPGRRRDLERKLNDRLGRICFYHDHRHGPDYLARARDHHLSHGVLWTIVPLGRVFGSAIAVAIAVVITTLLNVVHLRRHPLRLALAHLSDAFASTTYLANCYTYSGRPQLALQAAEDLSPFVYSRSRLPHVGYLMARAYALFLMNHFDEAAASTRHALWVLKRDRLTPASEHDRIHATGGALITRLWIDLARGYAKRSKWWQPFEEYVLNHPTALLESWLMEARVYAAYRQGKLAETEAAWKRFSEKAAQAEVMFVQLKTKAWVGMAYLDAGRTSDALDMADEVIRAASTPENPFVLALGLHLRGMALHAWEQLDDAEECLQRAEKLTCREDVSCEELYHSILLTWSLVVLDRRDFTRARELAERVKSAESSQKLSHDLHGCRAERVLGRVALAEGKVADAVEHLEHALALASAMDDVLERARSFHFLAQALLAQGNEVYARECGQECERLLVRLSNTYQLRRLGYVTEDGPESNKDVSALSRAIQFICDSDTKTTTVPSELHVRGNYPDETLRNSLLQRGDGKVSAHTLVALGNDTPTPDESD
jgi:tetratricopeptide (TPR) repeat protein